MNELPIPSRSQSGAIAHLGWAAVLNVPFVLCHPGWPVVDYPWVRALVVGLVLFVIPGLPWVGVMVGRGAYGAPWFPGRESRDTDRNW